jgi:hypothetical protein
MKITYKIKFTVQQSAKLFLRNVEGAIIDSPFGNLLARLYDQRYTNFISDQDIRTAVKALITDGETLTITDEKFGGIPYILDDSMALAFVRPGGREPIVKAEVELAEFAKYGRPMALVANKRPILFVNIQASTSKLMYSVAEIRGAENPDDKIQTVDIYTESHSDVLSRFFIKLLCTAYYANVYPDTQAVCDAVKPKESDDTQSSIPNHLLHGHDEDPVIHPPVARKAADTFTPTPVGNPDFQAELDFIRGDKVDDPESVVTTASPGEPVEVTIPETTKVENKPMTYPIKHEQVYRTAALTLSKLDLTAVIKAQRVIFPESEYWKEITRAKLYEVLMDELMKECDWEVGMIDQGNGPFLDHNPHPLGDDHEKFPFLIHSFVSQDPSSHKQTYKFTISYLPLSSVEELEIKK